MTKLPVNKLLGTVETIGHIPCKHSDAWETVCFYEQVQKKPSWLLRTVLPIPFKTTGCYGKVGAESRCLYSDGGYLAKKISSLIEGERVDFDIIEQSIRYHQSVALHGGSIYVKAHGDNSCSVHMITRYALRSRLLIPFRPFITTTIAAMHRFVMRDMLARLCAHTVQFTHRNQTFTALAAYGWRTDEPSRSTKEPVRFELDQEAICK
jgi:hypothetical protein